MNANNIYSALRNQNNRLLELKSRMRKTVTRICGVAPPLPGLPVGAAAPTQIEPDYLTELHSITNANNHVLDDLAAELAWLEEAFNTNESEHLTAAGTGRN